MRAPTTLARSESPPRRRSQRRGPTRRLHRRCRNMFEARRHLSSPRAERLRARPLRDNRRSRCRHSSRLQPRQVSRLRVGMRILARARQSPARRVCQRRASSRVVRRPDASRATASRGAPHDQLRSCFDNGSDRIRLPVAAKIALQSAGTTGGSAGSPMPVGGNSVIRKLTSTAGICVSRISGKS